MPAGVRQHPGAVGIKEFEELTHEPRRALLVASVAPCRILSLDGGGAKGFYTLGALKEIEAIVGRPLCECFDLIFGTSTGGINCRVVGARLTDKSACRRRLDAHA
jgi:predicted acylesterase/phospholipase RssA